MKVAKPRSDSSARPTVERRTSPRAEVSLPIRVRLSPDQPPVVARAGNFSRGGMFITSPHPLPAGTHLQVEMVLDDARLLLRATVEVVSQRSGGMGVRFVDIGPEDQELLNRWVADADRFGNYRLTAMIGRGGMAEVYRATALHGPYAGQTVAIKRILPELVENPLWLTMFGREAIVTARLRHPSIVEVIEVGVADGAPFIAMAYVDGVNAAQIIKACAQRDIWLPVDFCCFVASTVARALDYAHRAKGADGKPLGIVHRDVTPPNIFISRAGEVLLGDFGVAYVTAMGSRAEPRVRAGKVGYLAPEQVRNAPVSPATDVFGLGAVLYELLTRQRAFPGTDPSDVLRVIRERALVSPSRLRDDIPPALERLICRTLSGRREDRFMGGALARWLKRPADMDRPADAAVFLAELDGLFDHLVGNQLAIAAVVRGLFGGSIGPRA